MSHSAKKRKLEESNVTESSFYAVLPEELVQLTPLMDVYIDTIRNPKDISRIIIELNSILPIPNLTHLKRVKGKDILLAPTELSPEDIVAQLQSKGFDTSLLQNNYRKVPVAKIAPKTKKQYEVVHKLWPCNFHSNKYIEKLCTNTLFSKKEIEDHLRYMKVAINVAKFSKHIKVGVVVVDPKINSIVAVGLDNSTENPCQHGVMVAIDNVAFTQNGGVWPRNDAVEGEDLDLRGIPSDILENLQKKYVSLKFGAAQFKGKNEIESPSDGPYLCTGYHVYTTREPCITCAMGLVHSRVKRVFYGVKRENGALGSSCKIHTIKDLNHHYEVFAGLLEKECSLL